MCRSRASRGGYFCRRLRSWSIERRGCGCLCFESIIRAVGGGREDEDAADVRMNRKHAHKGFGVEDSATTVEQDAS